MIDDKRGELPVMRAPPVVSPEAWEAARQQMLVKEKALMRARDALAAERRRMPWMAIEKGYEFQGPNGKASLLDLFEGRPGCSAGPSTPAVAARSAPIRSPTSPI
jgi:predicted dithiol-disulfide oxidoreductase (DUF899 family)